MSTVEANNLDAPQPFRAGLEVLRQKLPHGSKKRAKDWARTAPEIKQRAFFSARVESTRFLARARKFLEDFLEENVEVLENGERALAADGRARFVREMAEFAVREGLGPVGVPLEQAKGIEDIRSESRLRLIFDTQRAQAEDFAYWKEGMRPELLEQWPAARFVRYPGAKEPRPRHVAAEGDVRLKNDFDYWLYQNAEDIGGFGVPHGPWGFWSRMFQEDVSREEAIELGLIEVGSKQRARKLPKFNDSLKASMAGIDPDLRRQLAKELGVNTPIKKDEIKPRKAG